MNTSEVLDLSKENIQPLKQGRNAVKLGTALQAQTNVELHQKLLAEREQFELLIRMYEGDDPLKPHYDYVHWIEQSFPKHGPESNLVQVLENALTTFKDDERYKQDLRYAELLIKYIDTQPNPIDIYQIVYEQGLCTMCAPFYKAWADKLDQNDDLKKADQIYELGKRVKAEPLDLLEEAHLRFQLSVGRRMLGCQDETNEVDPDYNRQALHKLHKKNVYSNRDPTGAPGRVKQQGLGNHNSQNRAPFKFYQDDEKEYYVGGESRGKSFPKQGLINKENTLKAGPWTQNGGRRVVRSQVPVTTTPTFRVHEDEGAALESGQHKTPYVPRALKPCKIDNFTCPLAVFEPPDPSKRPMYCKNKVYTGGREFQFEELRAALYNRRYEELAALKMKQEIEKELQNARDEDNVLSQSALKIEQEVEKEPINSKAGDIVLSQGNVENSVDNQVEENEVMINRSQNNVVQGLLHSEQHLQSSDIPPQVEVQTSGNADLNHEGKEPPTFPIQNIEKLAFEVKPLPLEANTSLFHCQSFTVNTKEAMNVVQEMWNSPSPAPVFGKHSRASRPYPASPMGTDEANVFKVPAVPAPLCRDDRITPVKAPVSAIKSTPTFPIYSDEQPTTPSSKPFQVYSDEIESNQLYRKNENINRVDSESVHIAKQMKDDSALPIPMFNPIPKSSSQSQHKDRICPAGVDATTLKMLAFQSDSDDSGDEKPVQKIKVASNIPLVSVTAPTPVIDPTHKSLGMVMLPRLQFQDEDRYEDMTCNTKAFDFVLPSSTPLVGHLKNTSSQPVKNNINGSYITEEAKKCGTKQDLSMIFEASKERYSSSSGSSGCKTQPSVCTVANTSAQPVQAELIEKLAQISANKSLGEIEKSLGVLNISGQVDPFATDLITQLLSHVGYPKKHHLIGLHRFETDAPALHSNSTVKLGPNKYSVIDELGKGSYARVLKATLNGQPVALKQQRPAWEWEWYIVQELQSRLPPFMMAGFLHMNNGYIFKNASILESEWAQFGSFLSVVNKLKLVGKGKDLHLALLFSIQMISIIEHLHKCKIIHGDVKPDNFVLYSLPSSEVSKLCLKLIDFGRSIDMSLFPEGTTFNTVVTTDGFQCNEMKEGRSWTYQTDLYGLAGSIYCALFHDYMKVVKKDKKWQLSSKIPRYMMPGVWQEIFSSLLNIESCDNLPDLAAMRETLERQYKSMNTSTVNMSISTVCNVLLNK